MTEVAGSYIGSAGTLIGTILETLGYYYQSYLLDVMSDPFVHEVGAFVYVIGVIAAIVSFIVLGQFRFSYWLILGPSLFFASVLPRTETMGADWRWGEQQRETNEAHAEAYRVAREIGINSDYSGSETTTIGPARVSSLFAGFNKVVSKTFRSIAEVINTGREDTDRDFILRAQLFAQLHTKTARDKNLRALIQRALKGQCQSMLEYARLVAEDERKDIVNEGHYLDLSRAYKKPIVFLHMTYAEKRWLVDFYRYHPERFKFFWLYNGDTPLLGDLPAPNFTSEQFAEEMRLLVQEDANATPRMTEKEAVIYLGNKLMTCSGLFHFVYAGLYRQAARELRAVQKDAVKQKLNLEKLMRDLLHAIEGSPDWWNDTDTDESMVAGSLATQSKIINYVARYMLRNEIFGSSRGTFLSALMRQGAQVPNLEVGVSRLGSEGDNEIIRVNATEYQEMTRMMKSATSLPYYQGLALFFLSVLYPFFMILLLVPGKHPAVILWFILWIWIKSWDIGYAVVMVLDDVLWSMFCITKQLSEERRILEANHHDIAATLDALYQLDPSFRLSTYYSIIGITLLSIPVIASHLILGSLNGGAGLIAAGVERYGEHFAKGSLHVRQMPEILRERIRGLDNQVAMASKRSKNLKAGNNAYIGAPQTDPQIHSSLRSYPSSLDQGWSVQNLQDMAFKMGYTQAERSVENNAPHVSGAMSNLTLGLYKPRDTVGGSLIDAGTQVYSGVHQFLLANNKWLDKRYRNRLKHDMNTFIAWAKFDTLNTSEMRAAYARTRAWGALPVTWIDVGESGFSYELAREIMILELGYDRTLAQLEKAGIIWDRLIGDKGVANSLIKAMNARTPESQSARWYRDSRENRTFTRRLFSDGLGNKRVQAGARWRFRKFRRNLGKQLIPGGGELGGWGLLDAGLKAGEVGALYGIALSHYWDGDLGHETPEPMGNGGYYMLPSTGRGSMQDGSFAFEYGAEGDDSYESDFD